MNFLPTYTPPDFTQPHLANAPDITLMACEQDGVAPNENFHATSNYPEYFYFMGQWVALRQSRMDCCAVVREMPWTYKLIIEACEERNLRRGNMVVMAQTEDGEEGVYVHNDGFKADEANKDKFSFGGRITRESPSAGAYAQLAELLRYEREHGGHIVWVLGPAVTFDQAGRAAMQKIIEDGFCHAVVGGNALATHDIEAAVYGTALGQNIFARHSEGGGHRHHLKTIHHCRKAGSIEAGMKALGVRDGIMYACHKHKVPWLLLGTRRDDGPISDEVLSDTYGEQQPAMRELASRATTIICIATMFDTISMGNMTPTYKVQPGGSVRPVYLACVDTQEWVVDKAASRGSAQTMGFITHAADFLVRLAWTVSVGH